MTIRHPLIPAVAFALLCTGSAAAQETANSSFLLTTPTAQTLPKGHGYASFRQLVLASVQTGVTDRFSLGVGTPVFVAGKVFWFMPKYQVVRGDSAAVAVGVMHGQSTTGDGHAGLGYAVVTKTLSGGALSGGVGWAYAGHGGVPVVMVGAEQAPIGRVRWMADAYLAREARILSAGVRVSGRRVDAEFGVARASFSGNWVFAPIINIICRFGN